MHPNNKLTINAVEAAPIDDFSAEVSYLMLVRHFIADSPLPEGRAVKFGRGTEGRWWKRVRGGQG